MSDTVITQSEQVKSIRLVDCDLPSSYGQSLKLSIEIESDSIHVGYVVVGIEAADSTLVGQMNITVGSASSGKSVIEIDTDPLYLKDATYSVNVGVYGAAYSDVHARCQRLVTFTMQSNIDGVSAYHFNGSAGLRTCTEV